MPPSGDKYAIGIGAADAGLKASRLKTAAVIIARDV